MEIDPKSTEGSSDEHGPSHVRSYECTFCKRGFSNAQALGGHMNIHRRDRAKLKQPSRDARLTLDISIANKIPSFDPTSAHFGRKLEARDEMSYHVYNMYRWPWIIRREDDLVGEEEEEEANEGGAVRQLQLFDDSPSPGCGDGHQLDALGASEERDLIQPGRGAAEELDLELRLGPEP